ncbi:hypothetical protein DYI37_11860 [Fulvimarina endophytica]|uniref:Uncharacterized protein n=1 Tax=Fulvimarina endophytica TaxID=2293836 RepID=A0A371X378_9HYPH|nr:hypothetical protein [Fulvimarina endophytica]RFC63688.1 hypothetical protein DYI37_11860 [Fulvimarina endophytica]
MDGLLAAGLSALAERASAHPLLTMGAGLMLGLAFVVTRSLLVLSAVSFLAIAAIAGTQPVLDPLARQVFPIGVFLSIGAILAAFVRERRR